MYLGYQNGKIKFYTEEKLDFTLYSLDKVEETEDEYVLEGDEYVLKNEEWEKRETQRQKQARIEEIKAELEQIDLKSIRPARAGETERLAELEAQAVELREELQELNGTGQAS